MEPAGQGLGIDRRAQGGEGQEVEVAVGHDRRAAHRRRQVGEGGGEQSAVEGRRGALLGAVATVEETVEKTDRRPQGGAIGQPVGPGAPPGRHQEPGAVPEIAIDVPPEGDLESEHGFLVGQRLLDRRQRDEIGPSGISPNRCRRSLPGRHLAHLQALELPQEPPPFRRAQVGIQQQPLHAHEVRQRRCGLSRLVRPGPVGPGVGHRLEQSPGAEALGQLEGQLEVGARRPGAAAIEKPAGRPVVVVRPGGEELRPVAGGRLPVAQVLDRVERLQGGGQGPGTRPFGPARPHPFLEHPSDPFLIPGLAGERDALVEQIVRRARLAPARQMAPRARKQAASRPGRPISRARSTQR